MPDDPPVIRKGTVAQLSITATARVIKAADIRKQQEQGKEPADG
jgi:hypothetical protein